MDLIADLRNAMTAALPIRDPEARTAFGNLDITEQTRRFLNWQSRLVHPHPRRVLRAEGFETSSSFQEHRPAANRLLARLAAGLDVSPHLSRGIRHGYVSHPLGRKHDPDFDLLLNEWGLHHLHLSSVPAPENDGFNYRGDDVLFAIIIPGRVYAIAVGHHRDWTAPHLVGTVIRSWPRDRFFIALNDMPGQTSTPDEHQKLRGVGVGAATSVEGRLHISRLTGGLTTALVSHAISQDADRTLRIVHGASRDPSSVLEQPRSEAATSGSSWPRRSRLRIIRGSAPERWAFAFQEEASGAGIVI